MHERCGGEENVRCCVFQKGWFCLRWHYDNIRMPGVRISAGRSAGSARRGVDGNETGSQTLPACRCVDNEAQSDAARRYAKTFSEVAEAAQNIVHSGFLILTLKIHQGRANTSVSSTLD